MIFKNSDFWIGLLSSSILISIYFTKFYFKEAKKRAKELHRRKSTYPEYEQFKQKRRDSVAWFTGTTVNTDDLWRQVYVPEIPGKEITQEEKERMTDAVKKGHSEELERGGAELFVETWKSRMESVGMCSAFVLSWILVIRYLQSQN